MASVASVPAASPNPYSFACAVAWPHHKHAAVIHFMDYNCCCIHQPLRATPAVEVGITNHAWTMEEIVALTDRD